MPIQNTGDENTAPTDNRPACNRCEGRATVRVTCTPIERATGSQQEGTVTTTGLCNDCLAQFRADPDRSFGTLFERSSDTAQRCIKVERL